MKDELGDRIKRQYENRTRFYLPRRTYTIIRMDGRAFHTYTRGCPRPFDAELMADMDTTARALCENIEGARFAFVQSDEISVLLTDFASAQTQAWFDGNLQKIVSLSASFATGAFNQARQKRHVSDKIAYFDARAFTIPDPGEVFNYFVWRQKDATRNSISMAAQAHLPHDVLQGKSTDEMQELLWQNCQINWNDYPDGCKRGRCIVQKTQLKTVEYVDKRTGETQTRENIERRVWECVAPPIWTQNRDWLQAQIPRY